MRVAYQTLFLLGINQASAQVYTGPQDPRLTTALTLDVPTTGVSTTPDDRLFLVLAHIDGSKGPGIVEYHAGNKSLTPYPNAEWNSYSTGNDPATHFVSINSQRIGPDGNLYLVDTGLPSFGQPVLLPSGPKLIQINISMNSISRIYPMGNATLSNSLLDDVRFHPSANKAYLTDAGAPALIVLDLDSGRILRVLENDASTSAYMSRGYARRDVPEAPHEATPSLSERLRAEAHGQSLPWSDPISMQATPPGAIWTRSNGAMTR